MELGERKKKILKEIVETYVRTGEPVGSKVLCEALEFSVSSATIRNEMAELVELGLLEQPHTSAGRVPSQLGYRYYINQLMNPQPIPEEERRYINGVLSSCADDPEHLLEETSQILAGMTKFTAVATTPSNEEATVRNIQFVQTGRRAAMVILMTSSGIVKNKLFRTDYDVTPEMLRLFYRVVNEKFTGMSLAQITPGFIQTMAASMKEIALLMPPVLMAVLEAAQESMEAGIRMEGQTNLLFVPEIELESAKRILQFLNRRNDIARLINGQNGSKVIIGTENEHPELADSSVVVARYTLGGHDSGAIGIIGPTRMDYAKMITSLEYLASTVGTLLSELLDGNR